VRVKVRALYRTPGAHGSFARHTVPQAALPSTNAFAVRSAISACRCSPKAPLNRPVDDLVGSGILPALFANLTITFGAQLVHLPEHSGQQLFRRGGAYAGALERANVTSLPGYLPAPVFDSGSEGFEIHQRICSLNVQLRNPLGIVVWKCQAPNDWSPDPPSPRRATLIIDGAHPRAGETKRDKTLFVLL
jgi:hypothetical protein